MNLTSNPERIRSNTCLGTLVSVSLVYQAVPQREDQTKKTEADNDHIEFVHKVYEDIILSTDSKFTSSSVFLSSTEPTEKGLSDREMRKRTDTELIAPNQDQSHSFRKSRKSSHGVLRLAPHRKTS